MEPYKYIQEIYLAHVDDCRSAGVAPASPADWVRLLDEYIVDAGAEYRGATATAWRHRNGD